MNTLNTLIPVFFMIVLGALAKRRNWISSKDNTSFKKIIFDILFPIMVFDIMLSSNFDPSNFLMLGFVMLAWGAAMFLGFKVLRKWHGERFANLSPFMLASTEGGGMSLPLYISILGRENAAYSITFDLASIVFAFIITPVLVSKLAASDLKAKEIIKNTFTNATVIAIIAGLTLNFAGAVDLLDRINFLDAYKSTMQMATGGISAMILFTVGFDFTLDAKIVKPVFRLMASRFVFSSLIIAGLFLLFPNKMAIQAQAVAAVLYFMTPTSFTIPSQLMPLYKSEEGAQYTSTFLSFYMVITLITYIGLVIYIS